MAATPVSPSTTPTPPTSGVTLTQAAHIARLSLKYGAIGLVALMVGRIFLTSAVRFWRAVNPPPPPPPTVGFGILPALEFPIQTDADKPAAYELQTANGRLPVFNDRAKVFLMTKASPSLLADQRARQIASSYNFVFEPEVVTTDTYVWRKSNPLVSELEMNIYTNTFEFSTNYLTRSDLLLNSQLPDDFTAVSRVKTFLTGADLLPPDIATAAGEFVYIKSLGGELTEAISLSDADYIQVDLNRAPIDGQYRIYTEAGYQGVVRAIVSGSFSGNNSIVDLQYYYQPVEYSTFETYPLRTAQRAWELLRSGEGYIAQAGEADTAIIRTVSLGYYEYFDEQDYLQPIYVFEGDDDFLGYVSAVDPSYLQSE